MVNIEVDSHKFDEAVKTIESLGKSTSSMQSKAINKTVKGVKTDVSSAIRGRYNLKKSYVDDPKRKIIQTQFASITNIKGSVGVLSEFNPPLIQFTGTKQTAKGVSVKVLKSGTRSVLKHAFIATMKSGHTGVFWREKGVGTSTVSKTQQKLRADYRTAYFASLAKTDPMRHPIEELFGPYLSTVISDPSEYQKIQDKASERLTKNIDHELSQELKKLA